MITEVLAWVPFVQQLIGSFLIVALLFISYEYHRRYLLSRSTHSKTAQAIYNDLRILFLLLGLTVTFDAALSAVFFSILSDISGLATALWASKTAFSRFLPKDMK
jgi:hypothetical protein